MAQAAPLSARSFYVYEYDLGWAEDRGCDAGEADSGRNIRRTVILDFGSIYRSGGGTWMVSAFGYPDFSLSKARFMVQRWAQGYWSCTGSSSVAYVGLGTNNSAGDISFATGEHVAYVAQTMKNWAQQNPFPAAAIYRQARPVAANDFEAFPGISSLNAKSRSWISGYNSVSTKPYIVNYGSANGCPQYSVPAASSCDSALNAETIRRVSFSGVAYPLPEIYATSGANARQWRSLSRYSANVSGTAFRFKGVMAQSGACSQVGGCSGINNTPTQAWNQLNSELNKDQVVNVTPDPPTNIWKQ